MFAIYKLIKDSDNSLFDIVGTVTKNRGIKDIEKFLKPSKEDEIPYYKLKNMSKAVELFNKHKINSSTVSVLVDSDCDGFTSAAIIIQEIRKNHPEMKVNYLIHEKRENGLTKDMMKSIRADKPDLVILPDSGSNDHEQLKELDCLGVETLILDHHVIEDGEYVSDSSVTVNPQLCLEENNGELAAGGIVFKFLQSVDEFYGTNNADDYLDLVAVSSIGDSMNQSHPETRYYIYEGLKRIKNPFIKQLLKDNVKWTKEIYPKLISFNAVNRINACIRVGTMEDKETMLRALLGEEEITTRISKYRGREREVVETLAEKSSRLCDNAKNRQNTRKKKLVASAIEKIETFNLDKNSFIIVDLEDVPSGFSGLVAMTLAQSYNKPAIVVSRNNDGILVGSLRGSMNSEHVNLKDMLTNTGLFEFCKGHSHAFGLAITEENFEVLNEAINKNKNFSSGDSKIEVDFEIHGNSLTKTLAEEMDSVVKYFGKGCEEPLFAIKDIEVSAKNIEIKNTTKIFNNGIELISFTENQELAKTIEENPNSLLVLTVVGKIGLNRFLDRVTPQVVIDGLRIKEIKEDSFGGFVF